MSRGAGGGEGDGRTSRPARRQLHGCHVVEGVVQLLADGLVLQFLGIQLIYCVVIVFFQVAVKDLGIK